MMGWIMESENRHPISFNPLCNPLNARYLFNALFYICNAVNLWFQLQIIRPHTQQQIESSGSS